MRLIDADAALKALRKCQTYLYDARDPELKIELSSAEAAINNLPTIQPEKAQLTKEGTTSDLISRQALCEYALNQKDKSVTPNDIMRFPPAQPEPQWIPVSERLPEKGGVYLVSVHHTIGAISVFHPEKDTYVDDVAIMKYYGKFPSTVRAWMLLPEPYKPNNK